jgi:hypothetical protein
MENVLPDEIIYMISEKLESTRDLVAFSLCSKRLNFICRDANYKNDVFDIDKDENIISKVIGFNKNINLKLDLSYSNFENIPTIVNNIHTLNLTRCEKITDVSALGNVHTLNLSYCNNIKDVSALGKVRNLDLSACYSIYDVSALGKVYDLNLSWCDKLKDVSMLGNVKLKFIND